jgi:hypothetical protein
MIQPQSYGQENSFPPVDSLLTRANNSSHVQYLFSKKTRVILFTSHLLQVLGAIHLIIEKQAHEVASIKCPTSAFAGRTLISMS